MSELSQSSQSLKKDIEDTYSNLKIDSILSELSELEEKSKQADFWSDTNSAQAIMKKIAKLHSTVDPWLAIKKDVADLVELASANDESMTRELVSQKAKIDNHFNELKKDLKFSGLYDNHDVILAIYAGAGGTDAQDWASMLLRMYTRWAEKNKLEVKLVEQSSADEAGIKSATLEIEGKFVFGKLKGEHGVHRLVRQSPFNSDNLRQTSFAKVDVLPKITEPKEIELDDGDIKIDVFRAGGHGGQSVNTTDSAVRVTHVPTGITVSIQNERSQIQNKETAMTILRSRLAQLQIEQHQQKLSDLKGPNQSAEWGNQIRNYVLHPYKQVKDVRTKTETSSVDDVLDGDIDLFIESFLEHNLSTD